MNRKQRQYYYAIERLYRKHFNELGIKVEYLYEASPYTSSAWYCMLNNTVTFNLTTRTINKHTVAHYIVAAAHELGHAHHYTQYSKARNILVAVGSLVIRRHDKHTYRMEELAYQYGKLYVPHGYMAVYVEKNEAYIKKYAC